MYSLLISILALILYEDKSILTTAQCRHILPTSYPPAGFFNNKNMSLSTYVRETQAEMKHVNWPSRGQTISFTTLVIGVSVITAVLLAVSDIVFEKLLTLFF